MAQKEVEDIFVKTMKKEKFKSTNSFRLAKTFISKKKEKIGNDSIMKKQQTKITEELTEDRIDIDSNGQYI